MYAYIDPANSPNVGKYAIHGASGKTNASPGSERMPHNECGKTMQSSHHNDLDRSIEVSCLEVHQTLEVSAAG